MSRRRPTFFVLMRNKSMATPQCAWACDNPQCSTECVPVPSEPNCICVNHPEIQVECSVTCTTEYTSDLCPICEPTCLLGRCPTQIQCEEISASWACRPPANCQQPLCQLVCEQPFCEYQGGGDPFPPAPAKPFAWWAILLLLLAAMILLNIFGVFDPRRK